MPTLQASEGTPEAAESTSQQASTTMVPGIGLVPSGMTSEQLFIEMDKAKKATDREASATSSQPAKWRKRHLRSMQRILDDDSQAATREAALCEIISAMASEGEKAMRSTEVSQSAASRAKQESQTAAIALQKALSDNKKLQELCRGLQRQNQLVAEESRLSASEQASRHQKVTEQVNVALQDCNRRLAEQAAESQSVHGENAKLRSDLSAYMEAVEKKEAWHEKVLEAKMMELKLADAKVAHQEQVAKVAENAAETYKTEVEELVGVRAQLASYEGIVKQAHEMMKSLQAEVEAGRKREAKQEKLAQMLRKSNGLLTQRMDQMSQELVAGQRAVTQKASLEKLCRALRAEREGTLAAGSSTQAVYKHVVTRTRSPAS